MRKLDQIKRKICEHRNESPDDTWIHGLSDEKKEQVSKGVAAGTEIVNAILKQYLAPGGGGASAESLEQMRQIEAARQEAEVRAESEAKRSSTLRKVLIGGGVVVGGGGLLALLWRIFFRRRA